MTPEQLAIDAICAHIQKQTGITVTPCDAFTGLRELNGQAYFNIDDGDRSGHDMIVARLTRYANASTLIDRFDKNGVTRLAVFLKGPAQ